MIAVWTSIEPLPLFKTQPFELLGPFNLLGEPLSLVALELPYWAAMAAAAAAVVVAVLTPHKPAGPPS